jgi:probable HAF family extracellular repeat protein
VTVSERSRNWAVVRLNDMRLGVAQAARLVGRSRVCSRTCSTGAVRLTGGPFPRDEMTLRYPAALLVAALALAACDSGGAESGPSFRRLGSPTGPRHGIARAVSSDGDVVVGEFLQQGQRAFRWTASDGPVDLGVFPSTDPPTFSDARDVSSDGSVVVGVSSHPTRGRLGVAYRWTAGGGMVDLGRLPLSHPPPGFRALANGVSADGRVVVGQASGEYTMEPFRWTESTGMASLGGFPEIPPGAASGEALDVSADGSVVVGWGTGAQGYQNAFRWTASGGMEPLGGFPTGYNSEAVAVSADGRTVVGRAGPGTRSRAFRWTAAEGVVWIGEEHPTRTSGASGVSADGRVVVGGTFLGGNQLSDFEAVVWTAQEGKRSVKGVLEEAGVDLTGWTLVSAWGVSADGRVVVGVGRNPEGEQEAWRAVLP